MTDLTPEALARLLADVKDSLRHVRVLDCGAHYCRYCPAKSPHWDHVPTCPYLESQRDYEHARGLIAEIDAVLVRTLPPATGETLADIDRLSREGLRTFSARERCQWHDTEMVEYRKGVFACALCVSEFRVTRRAVPADALTPAPSTEAAIRVQLDPDEAAALVRGLDDMRTGRIVPLPPAPSSGTPTREPRCWLIYDTRSECYWGPNRGGYWKSIANAGLYTEAEARAEEDFAKRYNRGEVAVPLSKFAAEVKRLSSALSEAEAADVLLGRLSAAPAEKE